ncbi:MAG: hypothetical protein UY26_C0003G0150 [Candidatus Jorgensenbacteria bacterium GW2011_GWA1_48_13]|uniref:PEGA domain-containing protein n=2 Tax=Candidatus Joergenseniibacteriota TaxID=1752739 RepID=A0A0G1YJI5_9BACT|nr:MAG: hypothetical protein UY26_C0003G0150 [Candidatus Jorgensenbacteria bacterium GW2011_GWA1_48_13]KKU99031.1 MAG: hypothetical protein UY32_C0008G0022 [Candidatus Jorgensenbacteria bacterium GW2011_GWC1_48_8]KKW15107.1 MAG: hypothetical protein UY55_C0002G0165 [Candidatus Jorgensenbacteria bacterium GW2011_GWB1_50_10]
MKTLKLFVLLALAGGATGCWNDPCEVFGPNCGEVTVLVTKIIQDDELTVYVNGEAQEVKLSDEVPTRQYRVRIQTRNQYYSSPYYTEQGEVFVSVWSAKLELMSRVKSRWITTDRVAEFEFRAADFVIR